jgi:hypothetical protein
MVVVFLTFAMAGNGLRSVRAFSIRQICGQFVYVGADGLYS